MKTATRVCLAAIAALLVPVVTSRAAEKPRPNILFILAEHHDSKVAALTGIKPAPHQNNLAQDPQHAAKLAEMRDLLLAEMRRLDDPYRFSDQPDDGLSAPPAVEAKGRKKPRP